MKIASLRESLVIDPLRLDAECVKQASLYFQYAEELADAQREYDEAARLHDIQEAETKRRIRNFPKKYELKEKPSEAVVNATAPLQPKVQEAHVATLEAKHRVDVLKAAVVALEHKKRGLTLLVNLHGMNYFASPRPSSEGQKKVTGEAGARVARKVGEALNEDED